jgi:nucleotide-binding universal stress UspA family protein
MFAHILVPLDGSALAECVIPHAISMAVALDARVTLLHVLEHPRDTGSLQPVDPLKWHLKKNETGFYLEQIMTRFRKAGLKVEKAIQEGPAAECIVNHANNNQVDLIILSTHGSSGMSMWSVSSVVQKIILGANKSTLLVRAHEPALIGSQEAHYNRLFVGLDCSARAELALPVAIRLANRYKANLIIGTVVQKPEIVNRLPVSEEDAGMIARVAERNHKAVAHYLNQLQAQLSQTGISLTTKLVVSENQISALHNMVEEEKADMVMLVAHGHSGEGRRPYGSVATSFIAYGISSLLIIQDLSESDLKTLKKETATFETQGH